MRFHLLSVAIFVALSSCGDIFVNSTDLGGCKGPDCSCYCPYNSCPLCPAPQQSNSYGSCGMPLCSCSDITRSSKSSVLKPGENIARGISTLSVYPTGPICSAFNIGPNLMLTVSTCIEGKTFENLFITLNTPKVVAVKVTRILRLPYDSSDPFPVLLITEMPKESVTYYELPHHPVNESLPAEIHRWEVSNNGTKYNPTRIEAVSHHQCFCGRDSNYICAQTATPTRMGWNDIGTPVVELRDNKFIAQGIYIGSNLYQESYVVNYVSLLSSAKWLIKELENHH